MRRIIKSKRDLREYLVVEQAEYGFKGQIPYIAKLVAGSERAAIWHWQKRLRKTEYYYNCNKKILYYISLIKLNHLRNRYGLNIGLNVCGKGLKIMHLGSILTNGNVVIGENVAIHINTSFVAQGTSDDVPNIGNNVVVGVGATVVGDVTIADGIAIGANALVNKSFLEQNIAIAGVPARKISDNGRDKWQH